MELIEQAAEPPVERVSVKGGPLHGNTYAVAFEPSESIQLKSLGGVFVYRFGSEERVLRYVGPAAPLV